MPAAKYSAELADAYVTAYLRLGAVSFACGAVGISPYSYYRWLHAGEQGQEPYVEFARMVGVARAEVAGRLINIARDDKGGSMFLLERLFPSEFGQPQQRGARDALQMLLELILPRLTPSARAEVLDVIAAIERERVPGGSGLADQAAPGAGASEAIDTDGEPVEPRRLESGTE